MDILEQLNRIKVAPDELDSLLEEAEEKASESGRGLFLVANNYPGDHIRAFAVYSRLEALATVVQEAEARGWILPQANNETITTRFKLIAAAATEPLIREGKKFTFDRAALYARALELAEAEGRA